MEGGREGGGAESKEDCTCCGSFSSSFTPLRSNQSPGSTDYLSPWFSLSLTPYLLVYLSISLSVYLSISLPVS